VPSPRKINAQRVIDGSGDAPWPTVAIVGGGFTGAAVAYHLACARVKAALVVFEPRALIGAGLAYGGADPVHRINVPASRMSLLPDDETHFARWLEAAGVLGGDPEARHGAEFYVRRQEFGRYVDAMLRPHVWAQRLQHVRDTVTEIVREGGRWRVSACGGAGVIADFVVLAATHPEPGLPAELAPLACDPRLISDGLADDALAEVRPDDRVLIVGAGLTAADVVASLDARGHVRPILMASRRGLRSRAHPERPLAPEGDFSSEPARTATELLARVRHAVREAHAAGRTWHPVFDALRIQGATIWSGLEPSARRRVVRHLRPYWDAHRFRLAPQLDALLSRRFAEGTLALVRARLGAVRTGGDGIAVQLRDARSGASETGVFDRIVIATGPSHGSIFAAQPALRGLAAQGFLCLDPTGLGLWTSREGRAIGPSGAPEPGLFVAGPLARGTFGELMGLPHVSIYANFIAGQVRAALGNESRLLADG
jgi:uncharacterized NAD(P)/FAD-binding protein YdhS